MLKVVDDGWGLAIALLVLVTVGAVLGHYQRSLKKRRSSNEPGLQPLFETSEAVLEVGTLFVHGRFAMYGEFVVAASMLGVFELRYEEITQFKTEGWPSVTRRKAVQIIHTGRNLSPHFIVWSVHRDTIVRVMSEELDRRKSGGEGRQGWS